MTYLQFTKMQGLGNDFIIVDGPQSFTADEVSTLCDRRFGVGADGILVVTRNNPVRMEYFNADGSAAEMCGNGLRCVARYVYDKGWAQDRNFTVQTPVGARTVRVLDEVIEVELGRIEVGETVTIDGDEYRLIGVGNPHAVVFVDDPDQVAVESKGRALQSHFDSGVNVEFAAVTETGIKLRIWERGVGETLACGTGMAAAVAAAEAAGLTRGSVAVEVPGGIGNVEIREGVAWLRGPAEYSFRGSVGAQ